MEEFDKLPNAGPATRWPHVPEPAWALHWAFLPLVILASAAAWGLLLAAFPPAAQNFPLGDDWAFVRGLILWFKGEGIHYLGWASMPELGQWLWAWPWVRLFGDQAVILRLSTVVLSWLGLWGFNDLLRRDGIPSGRAAFATACLAFSPLYFLLQGTFMTDVPALSFCLIALALYARALQSGRNDMLLAATVVALLAATTRQNALVVPLTAAILAWRQRPVKGRLGWMAAILVPLAVGATLYVWFQRRDDILPLAPLWKPTLVYLLIPFLMLHFLGLFSLPALSLNPRPGSWTAFGLALAMIATAVALWGINLPMVNPSNPSFDFDTPLFPYFIPMIGPHGPFAGHFVLGRGPLVLNWDVRLALTVFGCLAAALLLVRVDAFEKEMRLAPLVWFTLLQLPFIVAAPKVYDRYFLFLLPGAIGLAVLRPPASRAGWLLGILTLALFAAISVCSMHDWLAWNQARWDLGRRALAAGIHPWAIEGGFEWDGWFGPGPEAPAPPPDVGAAKVLRLPSSYDFHFWHVQGKYGLSFVVPERARREASERFRTWLPPGEHELNLIRYENSD